MDGRFKYIVVCVMLKKTKLKWKIDLMCGIRKSSHGYKYFYKIMKLKTN